MKVLLDRSYAALRFSLGVDDETRGSGSIVVVVSADDAPLYKSPVVRAGDPAIDIDIAVKGLKEITLQVTDADDGNEADHADLAWLRLVP